MKKLTILTLHLKYGGIEKAVSSLANLLKDSFDVEIVCVYKLCTPAFYIDPKVSVKYLTTGLKPNENEFKSNLKKFRLIRSLLEGIKSLTILSLKSSVVKNYLKNCDSDIIISTCPYLDNYLGKYGNSSKKIGWEHAHHHGNKKYIKKIIRSSKKLDDLVLVSNSLKSCYEKKLKKYNTKTLYIPNFLDEVPTSYSKLDNMEIISVGRLVKEKGFMTSLKVLNKLGPKYHLNIVGDGVEYDNLKNYIAKNNISNVSLLGFKDKSSLNKLYLNSSLYLMTSFTESFGLVLIEAMSNGLPCIAFDTAEGAKDLISDDYNGYLIKDRNIEKMENCIRLYFSDKVKMKELANNAINLSHNFTKEKVIDKWLTLLNEDFTEAKEEYIAKD